MDFYGFRDKDTASPDELEGRIHRAIDERIKRSWDESMVFPYVQRHEFEGLLFSEVSAFGEVMLLPDECIEELEESEHTSRLPKTSTIRRKVPPANGS